LSTDRCQSSYELIAMSLNGSRQKFIARVGIDQRGVDAACGTDRVTVDGRDVGRADFSAESRDGHLQALADWIAGE